MTVSPVSAADPGLGQGLHVCLVRVLDCLYENGLDACSLVLDGAGLESAVLLRQALAVIAEVGWVPRPCLRPPHPLLLLP